MNVGDCGRDEAGLRVRENDFGGGREPALDEGREDGRDEGGDMAGFV